MLEREVLGAYPGYRNIDIIILAVTRVIVFETTVFVYPSSLSYFEIGDFPGPAQLTGSFQF